MPIAMFQQMQQVFQIEKSHKVEKEGKNRELVICEVNSSGLFYSNLVW